MIGLCESTSPFYDMGFRLTDFVRGVSSQLLQRKNFLGAVVPFGSFELDSWTDTPVPRTDVLPRILHAKHLAAFTTTLSPARPVGPNSTSRLT